MASAPRGRKLPSSFFDRHPLEVAPELLGKVLEHGSAAVRIVEVEAYCGPDDPASHAFRGETPRTATMFGPPGRLYVYFTYGMHWCANVVTHRRGEVGAVLLRAGAPVRGIDELRTRRPKARRDTDLASGPAKLCQALGIDGTFDGSDLRGPTGGVRLLDDGTAPPERPAIGVRVGISVAADRPWRFSIPGDPNRSKPWDE
jgi:DNA-3-methyladenine glycosylase